MRAAAGVAGARVGDKIPWRVGPIVGRVGTGGIAAAVVRDVKSPTAAFFSCTQLVYLEGLKGHIQFTMHQRQANIPPF